MSMDKDARLLEPLAPADDCGCESQPTVEQPLAPAEVDERLRRIAEWAPVLAQVWADYEAACSATGGSGVFSHAVTDKANEKIQS